MRPRPTTKPQPSRRRPRLPAILTRGLSILGITIATCLPRASAAPSRAGEEEVYSLIREPSAGDWRALDRFNGAVTQRQFEDSLGRVFDPWSGLRAYLKINDEGVSIYAEPGFRGQPLVTVRFARARWTSTRSLQASWRPPIGAPGRPLAGLRIAIEPADIGGAWATMEDRSAEFPGYGRIQEGDLNVIVGRILRTKLEALGAEVFLVRDTTEPILPIARQHLLTVVERILRDRPDSLPEALRARFVDHVPRTPAALRASAGILLTKTLETRARAALVRREFRPDLTIVLQHDATPDSSQGKLAKTNRNIFFVDGAYLPSELRDPEQRMRLLTKVFENVAPLEKAVALSIAERFRQVTGYPPVLYGNSATTRVVENGNLYVVARNLDFNREHDGPVVVTEPYFMNQPETLARLLAGDYAGVRIIAGHPVRSIFREYADCVVDGILGARDAFNRGRRGATAMRRPER